MLVGLSWATLLLHVALMEVVSSIQLAGGLGRGLKVTSSHVQYLSRFGWKTGLNCDYQLKHLPVTSPTRCFQNSQTNVVVQSSWCQCSQTEEVGTASFLRPETERGTAFPLLSWFCLLRFKEREHSPFDWFVMSPSKTIFMACFYFISKLENKRLPHRGRLKTRLKLMGSPWSALIKLLRAWDDQPEGGIDIHSA